MSTKTQLKQQSKQSQTRSPNIVNDSTKALTKSQTALTKAFNNSEKDPAHPTHLSSKLITLWLQALDRFDRGKLNEALQMLLTIESKNSKINYNVASIYATLGDHETAVSYFKLAIENDNYMAISHFQIGVCRFLSRSYKKAARSFNTALKLLRGNSVINYQQLGLEYKLYSCEIMYNRALSYIYSGQMTVGIYDLGFAVKEKRYIPEHSILDVALSHFSQSEEFLTANIDMRTMLNLPKNFDARSQRFSLLDPPQKSSNDSSVPSSSLVRPNPVTQSPELSTSKLEKKKEMVYSLFSVPQGALFRLTETKVQYILGDKYMEAMMLGMPAVPAVPGMSAVPAMPAMPDSKQTPEASPNLNASSQFHESVPPRHSSKNSIHTPGNNHCPRFDNDSPAISSSGKFKSSVPYSQSSAATINSSASSSTSVNTHKSSVVEKCAEINARDDFRFKKLLAVENFTSETSQGAVQMCTSEVDSNMGQSYLGPKSTTIYEPIEPDFTKESPKQLGSPINLPPRSLERAKLVRAPNMPATIVSMIAPPTLVNQHTGVVTYPQSPITPESISASPFSLPEDEEQQSVHHKLSHKSDPNSPRIKIKIHLATETRVMLVTRDIPFMEFRTRVASKLCGMSGAKMRDPETVLLRVKDDDGDLVLLGDQEDLNVALDELYSNNVTGAMLKLPVYVEAMDI